MPALVRSEISARSSCATAPRTWKRKHALGRRRVDRVAQRAEVVAALLQPLDDFEEVTDRTGEAVEADHDEDIAGPDLAHQSCEFRPSPRRARSVFLVDRRAASRAQLVGLGVRGLIPGGDPRVAQKTSCRAGRGAGEGSAATNCSFLGAADPLYNIGSYWQTAVCRRRWTARPAEAPEAFSGASAPTSRTLDGPLKAWLAPKSPRFGPPRGHRSDGFRPGGWELRLGRRGRWSVTEAKTILTSV